jgi:DNA polymerase zeta
MAISLKRNAHSRDCQFVRAIVLVKGVHFYGFHSSWSPFLKIYIADPALVYRAVAIMQSGTVMQTRFRIFESHLSFILQFVSDFGLYGCGWIDLREVFERGNEDDDRPGQASGHSVDGSDDVVFFERSPHFRQSRMTLEVDAAAHHILNRHLLTARNIHHKLEIPAPPLPKEPLVPSVRELWEDERNRRLTRGLSPSPEMPLDPSAGSRGKGGEWVAEARWWDEIHKRIGRERPNGVKEAETSSSWERWVMTTFESVEAIWEEEFKVWKPRTREDLQGAVVAQDESTNPFATASLSSSWGFRSQDSTEEHIIDVDEAMLTSQEMPHFADHGDADWDNLLEDSKALAESRGRNFFEDDDPLNPEDGPPPDLQGEIEAQGDPHEVQTCTPVIAHAGPSVDMSGAPVAYGLFFSVL